MKNLPYKFDEVVTNYINNLKHIKDTFELIQFSLMPEDIDEYKRGWKGASRTNDNGVSEILIRPGLDINDANFTICHEIGHIELKYSGFTALVLPQNDDKNWSKICSTLNSVFSDFLINEELERTYKFSLNGYKLDLFNNIMSSLRYLNSTEPDRVDMLWLTLKICSAKINKFSKGQLKELRTAFFDSGKKSIFFKGEETYATVKKMGFKTPIDYQKTLLELVRYFRISDYVFLYDLKTKQSIDIT